MFFSNPFCSLFFFLHTVLLIYFFLLFIFNSPPPLCFSSRLSQDDFDPKTMFAVWVHTLGTAGEQSIFHTEFDKHSAKNKNNLQLLFKTFPLQINASSILMTKREQTDRSDRQQTGFFFLVRTAWSAEVSPGRPTASCTIRPISTLVAEKRKFINELVFFRILLTRAELLAFSF